MNIMQSMLLKLRRNIVILLLGVPSCIISKIEPPKLPFIVVNGAYQLIIYPVDSLMVLTRIGTCDTLLKQKNIDYFSEYFVSKSGRFVVKVAWQYFVDADILFGGDPSVLNSKKSRRFIGPELNIDNPNWAVKIFDTKTGGIKVYNYDSFFKTPVKKISKNEPFGEMWWEWRGRAVLEGDSLTLYSPVGEKKVISLLLN